ncbi:MAG TPA: BON domain-containing protein [Pseudomonadales bacterium]|nr:BON domain-containing protein [Pseudomonadales bacterium]
MSRFFLALLAASCLIIISGCAPVLDATHSKPIQQNPGKRTLGQAFDDENIEEIFLVNLKKTDDRFMSAHVNAVCFNGVIVLIGQVPSEELRQTAARVASNLRVRQVQNALTVGPNATPAVRSYDAWLTTKIKAKFAADNDINAGRVKVVTENGVIYLMGLVTQREADKAASLAQATDGAQRIVKAFEYID